MRWDDARVRFLRPFAQSALNPALPLALWFVAQDSLDLLHEVSGIHRPAVFLLGYLAATIAWASLRSGAAIRFAAPDVAFVVLLGLIGVSVLRTGADTAATLRYAVALTAVPWIAGRFLNGTQRRDFLKYGLLLSLLVSCPAMVYALAVHDQHERIYLMADWVLIGVVGLPVGLAVIGSAGILLKPVSAAGPLLPDVVCWVIVGGGLVMAAYAGARGLMFSMIVVLCLMCALSSWKVPRVRVRLVGYAFVVTMATLLVVPENRKEHFSELLSVRDSVARLRIAKRLDNCHIRQDSIAIRLFLAEEAIEQLVSAPLLGSGFGRFGLKSCFYGYSAEYASPHSTILHVAAELGIPGLAAFAALIVLILRGMANAIRSDRIGDVAWILMALWVFCFLRDQLYGSYLGMPHFYIVSALLVTELQAERYVG